MPLCIATNASVSNTGLIERALARVGLAEFFSHIFCFSDLGCRKDDPAFWAAVSTRLGVPLTSVAMVGDSLEQDVLAPARFGVQSVWSTRPAPRARARAGRGRPARIRAARAAGHVIASLQITPARAEDCAELARVHVASWQRAYRHLLPVAYLDALSAERREAAWREVLAQGRSELLVARADGDVAGFASFGPCRDEGAPPGRGELWALYVAPRHWSTGVGLALWRAAQARLVALDFGETSLWVLAGNTRAIGFYASVGFAPEPGAAREFEMGGAKLREIRYVARSPIVTEEPMTTSTTFPLEGGCDCGHVRYRMQTRPLFVHCCHCRWCQRETGAVVRAQRDDRSRSRDAAAAAARARAHAVRQRPGAGDRALPAMQGGAVEPLCGRGRRSCPSCAWARWTIPTCCRPTSTSSRRPSSPGWCCRRARRQSPEYYDREQHWPAESLARRRELLPRIEAYQAARTTREADPS